MKHTNDPVDACLDPTVQVVFAELCSLRLQFPHFVNSELFTLGVGFHLGSERLSHALENLSDCIATIGKEEASLLAPLA